MILNVMKDTTKKNKRDFNKHFNKINNGDFFFFEKKLVSTH